MKPKREYGILNMSVTSLKDKLHEERLKKLGLPPLEERRKRCIMIMVLQTMLGIYKIGKEHLFLCNEVTKEWQKIEGDNMHKQEIVCCSVAHIYGITLPKKLWSLGT